MDQDNCPVMTSVFHVIPQYRSRDAILGCPTGIRKIRVLLVMKQTNAMPVSACDIGHAKLAGLRKYR